MNFFLDVSDRVEKESGLSPIVQSIDYNAYNVVGNDWRDQLTEELRTGNDSHYYSSSCKYMVFYYQTHSVTGHFIALQ